MHAQVDPASTPASTPEIVLRIEPNPVYVERTPEGQALNFELVLENRSKDAFDIDRIQLSVFDAEGDLVLRRFVDGNGVRPSIATLDARSVAAGETRAVFNPFHTLPTELPLARLLYEVALSNGDGARRVVRSADVRPVAYRNHASLRLPLRGRVLNYDGHDHLGHHRRFDVHFAPIAALGFTRNFMRYSDDFVPVDAVGDTHRGDFDDNASWFGFGAPVLSVADGTVAAAVDAHPDNRSFDQAGLSRDPMLLFGNHVVIDHGHGEFSVYGHLKQGSVRVQPGQRVRQGEAIGAIGASGSAFFPHLHFELQTAPGVQAEGLPAYFDHVSRVLGKRRVPRMQAIVGTGEIVEAD